MLDERSESLDEREAAIAEAERLLAGRMAQIEIMRADILAKLESERSSIMEAIKKEQDSRLQALEAEQAVVLEAIAKDQAVKRERVVELSGIVSTMKPKQAATMLAGMDDNVALQVLLELRPKVAGKILGAMPVAVSQRLGDRMTVHRDPRKPDSSGVDRSLAAPPSLPSSGGSGGSTNPGNGLAAPAGAPPPKPSTN